jgi:pyroglutamyl-peptidase
MTTTVLLVTGFEPFDGANVNPSAEVAKRLDGRRLGGAEIRAAVLPVHHVSAAEAIAALLDAHDPAAVVHLGLAGERAQIALERIAINLMDYSIPDNAGWQARDEPCVAGGPAAYWSTLPLSAMLGAVRAADVPAYLSVTAGTYLCNFVMYATLHALAGRPDPRPAGFIHLPRLPSMVAPGKPDEPSMDLPLMLRGVEAALEVVAARR